MDEVENPDLPAAGESSPTLRPVDEDDDDSGVEIGSPRKDRGEGGDLLEHGRVKSPLEQLRPLYPPRPILQREGSAPPPQQPPPAPPNAGDEPPDSLTLAQLRQLKGDNFSHLQTPRKQQLLDCNTVYDFEYQDAQSFPVELEEWFGYSDEELLKLRKCKAAFNETWRKCAEGQQNWLDATDEARKNAVTKMVEHVTAHYREHDTVSLALVSLVYIALGVWEETAGRQQEGVLDELFHGPRKAGYRLDDFSESGLQIKWIVKNVGIIHECNGLNIVYEALRYFVDQDFKPGPGEPSSRNDPLPRRPDESLEMWCCLTLMYLFVEVARTTDGEEGRKLRKDIAALEPSLLNFFTQAIGRLRWDETAPIPLTKLLLLAWKSILVTIGGISDVENVKSSLHEGKDELDALGQPVITASPLDYHLFRQEISSKYPAYQPPPPLFPLEPENNSILPPLKHRQPSYAVTETTFAGAAPAVGTSSIMHQPVHIATPAPSPPPSPAGPGKAGKKQNYQTNQMFPFLYPPLDTTSNDLGGKGSTELQDALAGRKWEGSDIPASILEAAELFAKRMRATRAMKQLWETRVDFMKYERGWKPSNETYDETEDYELVDKTAPEETAEQGQPLSQTDEQRRLEAVDKFYRDALPHLQSFVIVLLKAVLQDVTDRVTRTSGQNGLQAGIQFNEPNGVNGSAKPIENEVDLAEETDESLDRLRTSEIAAKALSAILLLLLKWFKISHILQYEYMTQLLLDSNYVPLILKLWQTQEVGRECHHHWEKEDYNLFQYCRDNVARSNSTAVEEPESDDEAQPPPIKRTRESSDENPPSPTSLPSDTTMHPPEVDELGYPQTPMPSSPIKSYSYRNVFSAINYLRVLQKVTRRKTHRALLLVSYKSSHHLKKTLKVPIQPLRYYTLKLYKSQVPFCGRKWRQGNMKIITAVWLSVPAELRDDWLSGGGGGMGGAFVGDVDGTVEDALPLEQSLRALTHWWNVRNYPEVMGVDRGMLDEEMDYFSLQLERMDVGREGSGEDVGEGESVDENGVGVWQGPIEGY